MMVMMMMITFMSIPQLEDQNHLLSKEIEELAERFVYKFIINIKDVWGKLTNT